MKRIPSGKGEPEDEYGSGYMPHTYAKQSGWQPGKTGENMHQ